MNGTDKVCLLELMLGRNRISKMRANDSVLEPGRCCGERGENTGREKAAIVETSRGSVQPSWVSWLVSVNVTECCDGVCIAVVSLMT